MVPKAVTLIVTAIIALGAIPIRAQNDSESERLEKLERAVGQLQKRNAELEDEVSSLKKRLASVPAYDANGNPKPQRGAGGKTPFEKAIPTPQKTTLSF